MVFLPEWQAHLTKDCFYVETCMRYIIVSQVPLKYADCRYAMESFEGEKAYNFLLELACGLLSKMPGEPEIFGQIKEAWKNYREAYPVEAKTLEPKVRCLFQDTKRIRTNHLQGIAGASYYSATEKLISLKRDDTILIIGAGQFGSMLAANIAKRVKNVLITNRTQMPVDSLEGSIENITSVRYDENIAEVVACADHVLVAIPAFVDENINNAIQAGWKNKTHHAESGHLVHFCEYVDEHSSWVKMPNVYRLKDVLSMQTTQDEKRKAAIESAQKACLQMTEKRYSTFSDSDEAQARNA